jgi:hypothetical protein
MMEMPPNAAEKNSFEITPTDENYWAGRPIKNKQTMIKVENCESSSIATKYLC